MIRFHASVALILSLVLALGSVLLAPARLQAAGQTRIEICAGTGPAMVTLDAQGNPVAMAHHCPECLTGFAVAVLPGAPAAGRVDGVRRLGLRLVPDLPVAAQAAVIPAARGPPGGGQAISPFVNL